MSLVLAADYRVPDFDHWWAAIAGDLARLLGLGAHTVVVYRSLQDASRVFVTIGVRERGPVDALLRSPVMFSWFDSAGVDEIPPVFVGQAVEKLNLDPGTLEARPPVTGTGPPAAVIVGAIAPVGQLDRLRASIHAAVPRLAASGVRRFWIYRALDDQAEVMVLQEIATLMQGDTEILQLLNEQLTSELTSVNQYFLHSKMQANWGFTELAAHTRAESFEEMQHAETLTDRILLLDGLPNYQRLFSVRIGQTVREQFESDLAIEHEVVERLRPGIALCRERRDSTSAILLETIMADEETHIDYLETQLELMNSLGEQLYLAQCVARPPS